MVKLQDKFDRVCVGLIFLFTAFLILFGGIRIAGNVIRFAHDQQIQIINNFVESLKTDPTAKIQNGKIQDIAAKFGEAYLRALVDFEFVPRNDLPILAQVISAIPEETDILSFSYTGRNLTISTTQSQPQAVLDMAEKLEHSDSFANVVYSYYMDQNGNCIAEITLVSHHYEETSIPALNVKGWFDGTDEN